MPGMAEDWTRDATRMRRVVWIVNERARVVWRSGVRGRVRRAWKRAPRKKKDIARRAWSQERGWPSGW